MSPSRQQLLQAMSIANTICARISADRIPVRRAIRSAARRTRPGRSRSRAQPHLPESQLCPGAQALPQKPQLVGSICRSTSQPSAGSQLQSARSTGQAGTAQRPCLHWNAHADACPHEFPQAPQLSGSLATSISQPSAGPLLQSAKPGVQVCRAQSSLPTPPGGFLHVAVALGRAQGAQDEVEQPCKGSSSLTHAPPQGLVPAPHPPAATPPEPPMEVEPALPPSVAPAAPPFVPATVPPQAAITKQASTAATRFRLGKNGITSASLAVLRASAHACFARGACSRVYRCTRPRGLRGVLAAVEQCSTRARSATRYASGRGLECLP